MACSLPLASPIRSSTSASSSPMRCSSSRISIFGHAAASLSKGCTAAPDRRGDSLPSTNLLRLGINFANLAAGMSLTRAREVGVRKAIGAGRGQLVRQCRSPCCSASPPWPWPCR